MTALPSWKYGDPADFIDRQRKETEIMKKKMEQARKNKARRIQVLTKRAMDGRR